MNDVDRRRAAVATVLTVVALPALLILNRNDDTTDDTLVAGSPTLPNGVSDSPPAVTAFEPDTPVFVPDTDGAVTLPDPNVVASPSTLGANTIDGAATFKRYGDMANRPCTTQLVAAGSLLTVLNLDNGKSTTCINNYGTPQPDDAVIVLHPDIFVEIADLAQAPITVRITW
jgi:hypothetical protein